MRVLDIVEGTTVDGPGLRTSIYVAGCKHRCPECHNPQSWDFDAGREMTEEEVFDIVRRNGFNVTFSGGDPLYSVNDIAPLCKRIRNELHKNVWCYTGFLWESIIDKEEFFPFLQNVDVIVDGPYLAARRDTSLRFRGSGNQRIIDVQRSLAEGRVVQLDY